MESTVRIASEGEASNDDLSDVELEEDRSSSLSDIADKDAPENKDEASDDLSDPVGENESEAETERLEQSPHKLHRQKDVVLNSHSQGQIHERSPSKLHNVINQDPSAVHDGIKGQDLLSDDELSVHESYTSSRKSSLQDSNQAQTQADAPRMDSIEDFTERPQQRRSTSDTDSRKRKRSIMAGSGLEDTVEEPLPKRTGSVKTLGDDLTIDDQPTDTSEVLDNAVSRMHEVSPQENLEEPDGNSPDADDTIADLNEQSAILVSPRRQGRKKSKPHEDGIMDEEGGETHSVLNGEAADVDNGYIEVEDDIEAAARSEEEVERNRAAFEQFNAVLSLVNLFQDKLYNERLDHLNQEEAMLRQPRPVHPDHVAMMRCIDERRDEKFRIADQLMEYQLQAMNTSAKANRAQILTQYQQDVRAIREKFIERLGKEWYEIQHDRRTFAGTPQDFGFRMPTVRSEQVRQHVAYTSEVSILAGVAKHVGFPAAPRMSGTSAAEYEEDMERMGRTRHQAQLAAAHPFQELAVMRSAGPVSRLQPAEEEFLQQTPWANPRHLSHGNHLQRRSSGQQAPRISSPFGSSQQRQASQQSAPGVPISGTFSNSSSAQQPNGFSVPGGPGRVASPFIPFSSNSQNRAVAPSPLGSLDRSTSLSPNQVRTFGGPPSLVQNDGVKSNGVYSGHALEGSEVHPTVGSSHA